jgi:putative transposase
MTNTRGKILGECPHRFCPWRRSTGLRQPRPRHACYSERVRGCWTPIRACGCLWSNNRISPLVDIGGYRRRGDHRAPPFSNGWPSSVRRSIPPLPSLQVSQICTQSHERRRKRCGGTINRRVLRARVGDTPYQPKGYPLFCISIRNRHSVRRDLFHGLARSNRVGPTKHVGVSCLRDHLRVALDCRAIRAPSPLVRCSLRPCLWCSRGADAGFCYRLNCIGDNRRGVHGVEPICQVLSIKTTTYVDHRVKRGAFLLPGSERLHEAHLGVRGVQKLWRELGQEGFSVPRCTVARLMPTNGIERTVRGRPLRTTFSHMVPPYSRDIVRRQFQAAALHQRWVSDFTQVLTWTGFMYVACIIDAFTRGLLAGVSVARRVRGLCLMRWIRLFIKNGHCIAAAKSITAMRASKAGLTDQDHVPPSTAWHLSKR